MKQKLTLCLALLTTILTASVTLAAEYVVQAKGGPIRITPIFHASLQIEYRGKVIQIDPFSMGDYSHAKKADVILITHTHPDHLDLKAIRAVAKKRTRIIAPSAALKPLRSSGKTYGDVMKLDNRNSYGDFSEIGKGKVAYTVETVPAYNLKRGPRLGQKYHPKGEFNGYVLTIGGKRIILRAIPKRRRK